MTRYKITLQVTNAAFVSEFEVEAENREAARELAAERFIGDEGWGGVNPLVFLRSGSCEFADAEVAISEPIGSRLEQRHERRSLAAHNPERRSTERR